MQKLQNLSSLLSIEDAGKNTGARLFIISLESLEDVGKVCLVDVVKCTCSGGGVIQKHLKGNLDTLPHL